MKIAIDLRSLQSGSVSGVENYTLNLLDALLSLDNKNSYSLFLNSFKNSRVADFQYINSAMKTTRYPNKLLNLAFMARLVSLEKIIGDFDVLFMPNLNQFNLNPKTKLAITVHDLSPLLTPEFYNAKRRLWHGLLGLKRSLNRADVIFAVSKHTKLDIMRLFNLSEEKIKVIYPGIDPEVFNPNISVDELRRVRNKYELPGDFILFLNTIEPRKNLSGLLKAFELLDGNLNLVIAGRKGWKYGQIFREIKNSKKSAKIKFIGYVSEQDKPALIKLSKMLVYPSFYEGFGFQPLESMALGVPAIVSQVTSLPEVAGDAALLADPYNPQSIARAINILGRNQELRDILIRKGLQRVQIFNWTITAKKVLEELQNLKQ